MSAKGPQPSGKLTTWVALFRGVNVAGKNKLPMALLKEAFAAAGCQQVKTYIQSGNAVFAHASSAKQQLTAQLREQVDTYAGINPFLLLLSMRAFKNAVENNPFPQQEIGPKALHFYFLEKHPPHPDLEKLNELKAPSEQFMLIDQVFYLLAPDGIGRSKLAAAAERHLGVATTARNLNTVNHLADMLA